MYSFFASHFSSKFSLLVSLAPCKDNGNWSSLLPSSVLHLCSFNQLLTSISVRKDNSDSFENSCIQIGEKFTFYSYLIDSSATLIQLAHSLNWNQTSQLNRNFELEKTDGGSKYRSKKWIRIISLMQWIYDSSQNISIIKKKTQKEIGIIFCSKIRKQK